MLEGYLSHDIVKIFYLEQGHDKLFNIISYALIFIRLNIKVGIHVFPFGRRAYVLGYKFHAQILKKKKK